jgi:hypothetical protein
MDPPLAYSSSERPRGAAAVSVWRLLREKAFRNLLIADVFSDVRTFVQTVLRSQLAAT